MPGVVTFTLGRIERTPKVRLSIVEAIERETGQGVLMLAAAFMRHTAKLSDAAVVLRIVLADNGSAFTSGQILEMIEKDDNGIMRALASASFVLNELFRSPEGGASGTKGKARKKPADASP